MVKAWTTKSGPETNTDNCGNQYAPVQVVLEAYLRVLEDAGERHLIALYAGALGENAVEQYALFLVSLGLEADDGE